jgi:hypothetical protein
MPGKAKQRKSKDCNFKSTESKTSRRRKVVVEEEISELQKSIIDVSHDEIENNMHS